jgi:hypothetical protein
LRFQVAQVRHAFAQVSVVELLERRGLFVDRRAPSVGRTLALRECASRRCDEHRVVEQGQVCRGDAGSCGLQTGGSVCKPQTHGLARAFECRCLVRQIQAAFRHLERDGAQMMGRTHARPRLAMTPEMTPGRIVAA